MFGHRGTLFWPPPVRLFAQTTHAREASRQHPAVDMDAYAHTRSHADELWGPQYVPLSLSLLSLSFYRYTCAGTWKNSWKSFLWSQVDLNGPSVAVQWYQYATEGRTASFSTSCLPRCNLSLAGTQQQHLYLHHQQ